MKEIEEVPVVGYLTSMASRLPSTPAEPECRVAQETQMPLYGKIMGRKFVLQAIDYTVKSRMVSVGTEGETTYLWPLK